MNPVTSQPVANQCFRLPSPPTPPRTDNVSLEYGPACCLSATSYGVFFGVVGGGVGSLLEVAAAGALAPGYLPLSLCCAFGFSCFCRDLNNQLLGKKCQIDHAYLQELQTYNVQLRERVVMLLAESSHSAGTAEDRQQEQIADKVTDISQAV